MAVSTGEIFFVLLLGVGLIIAIWVYIASSKESTSYNSQAYARGANLSGPGNALLTCDPGTTIQVAQATMVCHDPTAQNFENPTTDPFLMMGDFDPTTTVDLTTDMSKTCDTYSTCSYKFSAANDTSGNFVCGPSGTPQLIATYTCVPKS